MWNACSSDARFQYFPCKESKWIPQVDCLLVCTSVLLPPSFQWKETRWNARLDCLQVKKFVETTCEVFPKFPMQVIWLESSGFQGWKPYRGFPEIETGTLLMLRFLVVTNRFPFLGNHSIHLVLFASRNRIHAWVFVYLSIAFSESSYFIKTFLMMPTKWQNNFSTMFCISYIIKHIENISWFRKICAFTFFRHLI